MFNQQKMPIIEAMKKYKDQHPIRFHVPGHKGRTENPLFSSIFPYDVTEITGLDDLHHPEEAILEAQQLAAGVFDADETFFLVGGSTVGNLAMLLASTQPGDSILVQRNVHKSVMNGIILSGVKPIYLPPQFDQQTGLSLTVSLELLEQMVNKHPVKVVFLSNPNYYGMSVNLQPYADLCRKNGIILLVDEAHGAHFGQIDLVPPSAMQAGATAAVQSTHKMLPALTMSSMLHIKGDLIDRNRVRRALTMVQSSSPSYPLMASLDYARHYLYHQGKDDLIRVLQHVQHFYKKVKEYDFPWLQFVTRSKSYSFLDPLKITLRSRSFRFHGFAIKGLLEQSGIYPELADDQHVLLALSPRTEENELLALLDVLAQVRETQSMEGSVLPPYTFSQEVVLIPSDVVHCGTERIAFKDAIGRISAEMVTPYPPGVPVLNPGERMDQETMNYLKQLKRVGCRFHDISDASLDTLIVVDQHSKGRE